QKIHTRKDLKKAEIEEVAIESLRTRIEEEGISLAGEERSKAVVINEAERGLRTISGTFFEDVAPRIQPVFVEPDMPLIPLEGFTKEVNLGGHPDVIDERGIIPDWKTSLTKFKSQRDADQSLQLTGYHILATKAKEVWEDMPDIKNIGFWSITPKGHRWLPTERGQAHWDSYIERAKWMVSCIEKRIFHRAAPGHWNASQSSADITERIAQDNQTKRRY
ncbi:MAG: PD-(D/E)XK nuclease family protein, partial [bacterium]